MKKYLLIFLFGLLVVGTALPVMAEQPLTQEGKKTVFQRVVSHPGARLYSDAAATNAVSTPRTFTSYYVYEKSGDMLRVGVSTTQSDGWLKNTESTPWPQAITMVFTDQMGRQPVLFFRDHASLQQLCTAPSIKDMVEQYVTLFNTPGAHMPADLPVIASEPTAKDGQVAQKDFYLLPVMAMDEQFKDSGTQLLEVACIDPGISEKKDDPSKNEKNKNMVVGIAFVIDTTISMKPYIDQTRNVIRSVFDKLQSSTVKDNVAFAVVAFRSNLEKSPGIEYTTKVISDFTTVSDRAALEDLLTQLEECRVSTHAFTEDSLAGVKEAADSLSWDKVNGKLMLMVTDAGPLAGSDPTSATHMTPEGMADYLRAKNIYLTVMHIKTPVGSKDHAYAEKSYRALSMLDNNRSSYIPIAAPTPQRGAKVFRSVSERTADTYAKLAENQFKGLQAQKPKTQDIPQNASPEDQAEHLAETIGYAMQLQFAGDSKGTRAPQVVKAWIADSDLSALEEHPNDAPIPVVYPAVLLTKLQLSQLRKQLKLIIETAEEAFLQDSEKFNFYEQLISAAAQMSRDPSLFNQDPNANLAQKGILLEVLDGLPYKSQVLRLRQEDWSNMSTGQQQEFIKRLKGLVRRYEEYDKDNTHWEGFGSANKNEWVYRVPLNMLP